MEESQVSTQIEDDIQSFAFRDGNLFVIDVSPEMFEFDPDEGQTYFVQCLHAYGRILSQKLMWNRRDWAGLIFYNCTKNWDRNPETEQILTVQKFSEVKSSMLKEIFILSNNKVNKEDYCDPSLDVMPNKCLHDVLWQACRSFDCIKIAMPERQVVLLTRNDNPLPDDDAERHKIRLRAKTYHDVNVSLRIIGLGKDWNHELFYKDIDVLANNAQPENLKRTKLFDLEFQVRFPARTSGHLKWKIGSNVEIPVFVTSFSCKTKYLKKALMLKDTNEILDVCRYWDSLKYHDDSEDEGESEIQAHIPNNLRKGAKYGGKWITFQPEELKQIRISNQPGINLIGFKPISLELSYHIKPAKFIGIEKSASKDKTKLFAGLLDKCRKNNVMIICSMSHRAGTYLAKMIPCTQYDGFYLCKIAYREQINNIDEYVKSYIYDDKDEDELPIDEEGVDLMKKIIKKLRKTWDPYVFTNPKLNRQLVYIEALAMEIEATKPEDSTRPKKEVINARLNNLIDKFENMFGKLSKPVVKRGVAVSRIDKDSKMAKTDDETIRGLITSNKLKDQTVLQLKSFCRTLGLPLTGLKIELIERIIDHCKTNDA